MADAVDDIEKMLQDSERKEESGIDEETEADLLSPEAIARSMELRDLGNTKRSLLGQCTVKEKEFDNKVISGTVDEAKDAYGEFEAAFVRFHGCHMKYCEIACEIGKDDQYNNAMDKFNNMEARMNKAKADLKTKMDAVRALGGQAHSDKVSFKNVEKEREELTQLIRMRDDCVLALEEAMDEVEEKLVGVEIEEVRDCFQKLMTEYQKFIECNKAVMVKANRLTDIDLMSSAQQVREEMEERFGGVRDQVKSYLAEREIKVGQSAFSDHTDRTTESVRARRLKNKVDLRSMKVMAEGEERACALELERLEMRQKREREELKMEHQIRKHKSRTELTAKLVEERELKRQEQSLSGIVPQSKEGKVLDSVLERENVSSLRPDAPTFQPQHTHKLKGAYVEGAKRAVCRKCSTLLIGGSDFCHRCGFPIREAKVSFDENIMEILSFSPEGPKPTPVAFSTPVAHRTTPVAHRTTKSSHEASLTDSVSAMSMEITRMQQQFVDALKLPQTPLEIYDGDPKRYHSFMRAFHANIGDSTLSEAEKLSRLIRSCSPSVQAALEPFELKKPEIGYPQALQELKTRYGDDLRITKALVTEWNHLPEVKDECAASMQRFVDKVRTIYNTLDAIGKANRIENEDQITAVLKKLPKSVRGRYRRLARAQRAIEGEHPNLSYFVRFVTEIANEWNDPD